MLTVTDALIWEQNLAADPVIQLLYLLSELDIHLLLHQQQIDLPKKQK